MMTPSDEIIGQVKVGAVLRANDGRRFVIRSIRKANPLGRDDGKETKTMYTTNDETDPAIAALEKQLGDLDTLLGSAIGKQADAGKDDGDDTMEIAKLQSQVAELGKTLTDAIAVADNENSFERVADYVQKRDGCSRLVALQKARVEAPDQFRRYQLAGVEIAKAGPAQDRISGPSAFDAVVQQIMRDKKLRRHVTMQKARVEHPQLFKAYQAGA